MFHLTNGTNTSYGSSFQADLIGMSDRRQVILRIAPLVLKPTRSIICEGAGDPVQRQVRRDYGRAKILSNEDIDRLVSFIREHAKAPLSLEAVFLSTVFAGLRISEAATLTLDCLTDANGNIGQMLHVRAIHAKNNKARAIPIHPRLREAVLRLRGTHPNTTHIAFTNRYGNRQRPQTVKAATNMVSRLYQQAGFVGCSTHSGRRTFITNLSRVANLHGASLRDVQRLAGHARLDTTESYIEPAESMQSLVFALGRSSDLPHQSGGEA